MVATTSPGLVATTRIRWPFFKVRRIGEPGTSQSGPSSLGQLSVIPSPQQPTSEASPLCTWNDQRTLPVAMLTAITESAVLGAG